MKKLIFLILLGIFLYSNVFAQNMVFTFTPKDANYIIDSISAINLATGQSVLVKGTNEISFTSTLANINVIPQGISIYPNPSPGQSEMHFYSKQNEDIKIILINAAGQIVASEKQQLTQGFHKFKITIGLGGMYIVQVIGIKNKFSQKIITTGNNHNKNNIQYIGLTSTNTQKKSAIIDEPDLIHFLIYSGDNITKIADSPSGSKTYEVEFFECKDGDGKNYTIVQIGEQWWMAENLAYLPGVSPSSDQSYTEPFYYVCDYEGTEVAGAKLSDNYSSHGVLYNWAAGLTACPEGWNLPSNNEWEQLAQYVSDQKGPYTRNDDDWYHVGKHLKATIGWNWDSYHDRNGNGTDDFGFSGLPGGHRDIDGYFITVGYFGNWWSSAEDDSDSAWRWMLDSELHSFHQFGYQKDYGMSVRCVIDQ